MVKTKTNTGQTGPLYSIDEAARLIGTKKGMLREYEKYGLIEVPRRGKQKRYSVNDIIWLRCIRDLIHEKRYSIEAIRMLLKYAPCWEINNCPEAIRKKCAACGERNKPCWERSRVLCKKANQNKCSDCLVYLSRK